MAWYHISVPGTTRGRKKDWLLPGLGIAVVVLGLFVYVAFTAQKKEAAISISTLPLDSTFDVAHMKVAPAPSRQAPNMDDELEQFLNESIYQHEQQISLGRGIVDKENYLRVLDRLKQRKDRYVTEFDAGGGRNYIDDRLMASIQDFPLRKLRLDDVQMTVASIGPIAQMRTLESLSIDKLPLNSEACRVLAKMPNLRDLSALSTGIDDQMFGILCSDRKLAYLAVTDSHVGEAGIRAATREPSPLISLRLMSDKIDDKCVEMIAANMPNLVELHLDYNRSITDKSLPFFEKMHSLRSLGLNETSLSDAAIAQFKVPFLQRLYLSAYGGMTRKGVIQFRKNNPQCAVQFHEDATSFAWFPASPTGIKRDDDL